MTPNQHAKKLVNQFYIPLMKNNYPNVAQIDLAIECALIAVDEILALVEGYEMALRPDQRSYQLEYYQEVKQEIEKL